MVQTCGTVYSSKSLRARIYECIIGFLVVLLVWLSSIALDLWIQSGQGQGAYSLDWDLPSRDTDTVLLPSNLPPGYYSLEATSTTLLSMEKFRGSAEGKTFSDRSGEEGSITGYLFLGDASSVRITFVFSDEEWEGCSLTLTGPYPK